MWRFKMQIENMTIEEIESFIRNNFPDINLYMRCLDCDEYYSLSEMNLNIELCQNCSKE